MTLEIASSPTWASPRWRDSSDPPSETTGRAALKDQLLMGIQLAWVDSVELPLIVGVAPVPAEHQVSTHFSPLLVIVNPPKGPVRTDRSGPGRGQFKGPPMTSSENTASPFSVSKGPLRSQTFQPRSGQRS